MKRWFAMACQFTSDAKIEQLGEEVGPGGPLVICVLLGQAKLQGNGGHVEGTFRNLARDAFLKRGAGPEILKRAGSLGVLEIQEQDDRGFKAFFPSFHRYQDAFRKQEAREQRKAADSREGPGSSVPVRSRPKTSPTRTGTGTRTKTENKPREYDKDWQAFLAHYRELTGRPARGSKVARGLFNARRRGGFSLGDLKAATVGCHGDDYCRRHKFDRPETILAEANVERYIALAKEDPDKPPAHRIERQIRDHAQRLIATGQVDEDEAMRVAREAAEAPRAA